MYNRILLSNFCQQRGYNGQLQYLMNVIFYSGSSLQRSLRILSKALASLSFEQKTRGGIYKESSHLLPIRRHSRKHCSILFIMYNT